MNIKKQTFNSDMEIKPGEIYDLCTFMRNVTQSGGEIRSSEIRGNFKTKNAEKINDNEVFGKIIIAENDCSSNSTQPIHTLNIVDPKAEFQCKISREYFLSEKKYFISLQKIQKIIIIENKNETVTLIFMGEFYNDNNIFRSNIKRYSVTKNVDVELIEDKKKFVEVMCLLTNSSGNTILGKEYKVRIDFLDECNCEEKLKINNIINELIIDKKIKEIESEFIVFSCESLKETKELQYLIDSLFIQQVTNIDSANESAFIAENDCSSNSTQPIHTLNIGEVNGSVNICSEYTTVVTGNNNNVNSISF